MKNYLKARRAKKNARYTEKVLRRFTAGNRKPPSPLYLKIVLKEQR